MSISPTLLACHAGQRDGRARGQAAALSAFCMPSLVAAARRASCCSWAAGVCSAARAHGEAARARRGHGALWARCSCCRSSRRTRDGDGNVVIAVAGALTVLSTCSGCRCSAGCRCRACSSRCSVASADLPSTPSSMANIYTVIATSIALQLVSTITCASGSASRRGAAAAASVRGRPRHVARMLVKLGSSCSPGA